jgi:hypothetical protein
MSVVYELTIILEPTELEKQAGKTDKVLLKPCSVVADRQFTAIAKAVLENAEEITENIGQNGDIARAKVLLREFDRKD